MKKILSSTILVLSLLIILVGCGGENSEAPASTPVEEPIETVAPKEEFINTAEEIEIFSGDWTVGTDIAAGRYDITADSGMGNIVINNKDGFLLTNEILRSTNQNSYGVGVTKITLLLNDGFTISVSGLDGVKLTPAVTELKTVLNPGIYKVGRDIEAGSYIVTTDYKVGNVTIYDENGNLDKIETLTCSVEDNYNIGVEKIKVNLKDNYRLEISALELVNFEKMG